MMMKRITKFGLGGGMLFAVSAFVISALVALALIGGLIYYVAVGVNGNTDFSSELHTALVENCEKTRTVLVEGIEGELVSVDDPRIPELFPDVPKAVADRFIRDGNREKHERIDKIRPSGCKAAYPAP